MIINLTIDNNDVIFEIKFDVSHNHGLHNVLRDIRNSILLQKLIEEVDLFVRIIEQEQDEC